MSIKLKRVFIWGMLQLVSAVLFSNYSLIDFFCIFLTAMSLATLKSLNISHILTIDSVPLPAYVTSNSPIINKYIQVSDMPRENLLE